MTDKDNIHSYESNFNRLQQLVDELEKDGLGLEESLRLFEEGVRLADRCDQQLSVVEQRVQVLVTGSETLSTRIEIPLEPVLIDNSLETNDDESR